MSALPLAGVLKLTGIEGESAIKKHEKKIVVLSFDQSVRVPVIVSAGGGGQVSGRPIFSSVRFRKPLDKASVPLLLACASGTHIQEATFTFLRTDSGLEIYVVKLTDVLATDVGQVAGTGPQYPLSFTLLDQGSDSSGFLDEVTLAFQKIEWTYQRGDDSGAAIGPPVKGGWDVAANKKI